MGHLTRDDQIPRKSNTLWVLVTKASQKHEILCYAPKWDGYWTHYTPDGTVPCYKDRELCFKQCDEASRRWYGFIHGYSHRHKKQVFAQITAVGAREIREALAAGTSLRGLEIVITRGNGPNAHVHVEVKGRTQIPLKDLPPYIDSEPSVRQFWKIREANAGWDRSIQMANGQPPSEWEGGSVL
jgi:hypothetical protein